MQVELTPDLLQTLDIEWVVEETATLVKNARERQLYRAEVSHQLISRDASSGTSR